MKRLLPYLLLPLGAFAGIDAYIATSLNTPCTGYSGQVVGVQFASTNSTGTATISAVTDLNVGGSVVSFTNTIASATLDGGVAMVSPTNTFVASRQRIIVSGNAFPGGSATVWVQK